MNISQLAMVMPIALCLQLPVMAENGNEISLGGLLEIELGHHSPYSGDSSSDISLATAEIGITGKVNKRISGEVILLHEEDDTNLEVDVAALTYQQEKSNWSITAGQRYVPFGSFETYMVSDALPLEMAETRETVLQANYQWDALSTSVYIFNGSNKQNSGTDDKVDNFGFNLSYVQEGNVNFTLGAAYINDIGDSNGLQDSINASLGSNNTQKHVPGINLAAMVETGRWHFIVEHVSATEQFAINEVAFNGTGAKPSATQLEVAYDLELAGKPANLALAYQTTDEALALGLAKTRLMAALSADIMDNTRLAFEIAIDDDYDSSDGGTGQSANTITAQLAIAF